MSRILKNLLIPAGVIGVAVTLASMMIGNRADLPRHEHSAVIPLVEVLEVHPGPVPISIHSRGIVSPRHKIDLVSEVSGKIVWVNPDFQQGNQVMSGQTLLRIDPIEYQVALSEAEANLVSAELALADAEVIGKNAAIAEARALRKASADRLRRAQNNLENTELKAPFDAIVDLKRADIGQYIQTGTAVMTLLSIDRAEVRLPILPSDSRFLPQNRDEIVQLPLITLSSNSGGLQQEWQARIDRIERRTDDMTRVFFLTAQVERPYDLSLHSSILPMGLFVETRFQAAVMEDVVRLPMRALHKGSVYVLDEGAIHRRVVTVIREEGNSVIISDGLQAGERVVTTRLDLMVDGMAVRVAN